MKREVSSLKPHPRNRRIYGDEPIDELAEQIERTGKFEALIITPEDRIISGHKRWRAAKKLGWETVPVEVRKYDDENDELEALLVANAYRDKNAEQMGREFTVWKEVEADKAKNRMQATLKRGDVTPAPDNFPERGETGDARDKAAAHVGFGSGKQAEKAEKVIQIADKRTKEGKPEEAAALLKKLNTKSVHAAYNEIKEEVEPPKPAPPPPSQLPARVDVHDATEPWPVKDVDLIVTSPPYGLDKPYHGQTDEAGGWERFMLDWTKQAHKASAPNGRLALNVPLDTTKPIPRPTYAQAIHAAVKSGWIYRFTLVWNEGNVSKSTGRGSVDSCGAPHCIAPVEMIAVFGAGEDWPIRVPSGAVDMTHEEWLAWTNGLWTFNGEGRAWEGHPAPFPEELPRLLFKFLSARGATVADCFCGSGTTIKVAVENERKAVGFDVSKKYVDSTARRISRGT
jgi:site-specific DNA-methyltransferase (adenine-specific)